MASIDEVADAHVEAYASADPVEATFLGIAGHEHEMTDYSPDGFAHRDALARQALSELDEQVAETERERVAADAMRERLGLEVELYDAGETTRQLNSIASPLQTARMVFDLMPTDTAEDWQAIASRLHKIADSLAGYRATLRAAAADGRPAARRQVEACLTQCESWLPGKDDLFGALIEPADAPDALRADLAAGANTARSGVRDFATFLREELLPLATEVDAVGHDRYALCSRQFLGARIDLDETYAWGWEELHRIEREMADVADRIVPGGSIEDAVAALEADPERRIDDPEQFRAWMQREADRSIAELADRHFDIPEPIRRLECKLAPTRDGIIYYTGPSEDFSRPGRMWWSVPADVTSLSTWRELTTVYHEGVPGHHLQIGQTVYRTELLNRWQRLMCWVSGHGEGWALYAERLMDELGYFTEPGNRLGMLDVQGMRAVRVIVDIGMHLELTIPPNPYHWRVGERWTPELGLEFMRAHVRMEDGFIRAEVDRYLGWPGQAPSYKVGERLWRQARADAEARKGADFDLKAFHRAALDLGSIGLDPLQQALARL